MNEEQAIRCIEIAKSAVQDGDLAKAMKFLQKSIQLHETLEATRLLEKLEKDGLPDNIPAKKEEPSHPFHASHHGQKRSSSHSKSKPPIEEAAESDSSQTYSKEDELEVQRILSVKADFYAVLELEKTCTEDEIKKAYRRIAKRCHPDKNKAPGSVEAFKVIAKAYQILTNEDKRKSFDVSGLDPDNRFAGHPSASASAGRPGFANQFEAEVSPEELFEMFFGNMGFGGTSFRSASYSAGPGFATFRVHQPNLRQRRHHEPEQVFRRQRPQSEAANEEVSLRPLFTLLAILFLSLLSSIFSAWDPPVPRYSLQRHPPYVQQLRTNGRGVPYYVDPNNFPFLDDDLSVSDVRRLREVEAQVEQGYLRHLQNRCQYEMQVKREKLQEARGFWGVDSKKLAEANNMKMEACDALRSWR